jgi:hypothetical protein
MKKNMGTIDKAVRIIIAIVIVILAVTNVITGILAFILLILSGIFVLTSIFGICPLYLIAGVDTRGKK